jgi:hypothetical protein
MQSIAEEIASNFQGKILRYRVVDDVLIILFVDGRKHYVKVGKP